MAFGDRKKTGFHTKKRKPMKRSAIKRASAVPKSKPKKKKKAKRQKLPKLSTMRNKCDKLLTPITKLIHPVCLFNGYEKCTYNTEVGHHHILKSVSNANRYYLPNLVGLCTICHCRLHHSEILWTGRVIKILGMDWIEDLEAKKREYTKADVHWYIENYERLSKILEDLSK